MRSHALFHCVDPFSCELHPCRQTRRHHLHLRSCVRACVFLFVEMFVLQRKGKGKKKNKAKKDGPKRTASSYMIWLNSVGASKRTHARTRAHMHTHPHTRAHDDDNNYARARTKTTTGRAQAKEAHPEAKMLELSTHAGAIWQSMSAEKKQRYIDQARNLLWPGGRAGGLAGGRGGGWEGGGKSWSEGRE